MGGFNSSKKLILDIKYSSYLPNCYNLKDLLNKNKEILETDKTIASGAYGDTK